MGECAVLAVVVEQRSAVAGVRGGDPAESPSIDVLNPATAPLVRGDTLQPA